MAVNIKIYIISLKYSTEKRLRITEQLAALGLSASFIDAIDGKSLTPATQKYMQSKLSPYPNTNFSRYLSFGEMGCLMSHLSAYSKIEQAEIIAVFEDDVVFSKSLVTFLESLDDIHRRWEIILLGHEVGRSRLAYLNYWSCQKVSSSIVGIPVEQAYGAHAYIINYSGALKVANLAAHFRAPIDHFIGDIRKLNILAVKPPLVTLRDDHILLSTLESERQSLSTNLCNNHGKRRNPNSFFFIYLAHVYNALIQYFHLSIIHLKRFCPFV